MFAFISLHILNMYLILIINLNSILFTRHSNLVILSSHKGNTSWSTSSQCKLIKYYVTFNYNIVFCKLLMILVYVNTFFIIRFIFNAVQTLLLTANTDTSCNVSCWKKFPKDEIQKVDFWTENKNSYMLSMFVEPFRQMLQPSKGRLIA